jgi:hypothetical protein
VWQVTIGRQDEFLLGVALSSKASPASCEGGSEVSHRRELSAADLPVCSVRSDDVSCDFDAIGRQHVAADFGCGAC